MQRFTDLGDAYVTLPLLAVAWLALLLAGRSGTARAAWPVLLLTPIAIAALKIGFGARPGLGAPFGVHSPSGHTASAALAVGAIALVLGAGSRSSAVAAFVAGLAIGASRVALGVHSVSEVVIGEAVGTGATIWLGRRLVRRPLAPIAAPFVLAASVVVLAVCWGHQAQFEPRLQSIATRLGGSGAGTL